MLLRTLRYAQLLSTRLCALSVIITISRNFVIYKEYNGRMGGGGFPLSQIKFESY